METKTDREELDCLEILRELRDECSDEIPDKIIRGSHPDRSKFKVRKNWFHGVVGYLGMALEQGLISGSTAQTEAENFIDYYTSDEFGTRLTTAEDIERANSIINLVLGEGT